MPETFRSDTSRSRGSEGRRGGGSEGRDANSDHLTSIWRHVTGAFWAYPGGFRTSGYVGAHLERDGGPASGASPAFSVSNLAEPLWRQRPGGDLLRRAAEAFAIDRSEASVSSSGGRRPKQLTFPFDAYFILCRSNFVIIFFEEGALFNYHLFMYISFLFRPTATDLTILP